ncbi:MAG: hypothetical protein JF589_10290 [Gemmatimonadetes bacterium]|jgi:hypothetical protein|nr:hypothetical protein [Gemmatimonadota bacterium]
MRRPKPISPRIHGVLDYTTSAAVAVAPRAMNFPRPARLLFESLAAGYTGLSTTTDYPLSLKRLVPFKAHGATELAIAAVLPIMPYALGFADHRAARNLCFGLTALTLVVAALTDWDGVERGNAAMRG